MASVQIPPPIDGVRDSSSTPPAVTLAAPRASTLSGQPNEVESRLLDEVHRVVIDFLADRFVVDRVDVAAAAADDDDDDEPTAGQQQQKISEEKSSGDLAAAGSEPPSSPSSSSSLLRLDVLLSRFLYLNREALLEEIRARKDDVSWSGGGGKRAGSAKRRGRARKKTKEDENAEDDVASKPKRTRKKRRGKDGEADEGASKPKRKRGRRLEKEEEVDVPKPKRKRGRPKKGEEKQRAEAKAKAKAEVEAKAKARAEAKAKAELERKEERERKREVEAKAKAKAEAKVKSELERKEERERKRRRLQEESDRKFDEMFEELIRFKKEHGHVHVPHNVNDPLSKWVNNQRQHYKWLRDNTRDTPPVPGRRVRKSALTAERIQRLTDIGFQFRVKTGRKNYTFEERLEQLAAAKAQLDLGGIEGKEGEGDSGGGTFGIDDIPKDREEWVARIGGELDASIGSGDGDDLYQGLRSWLVVQIQAHHELVAGKKSNIPFSHERAKRISDLGFVFPTEFLRAQSWEKRFQELLAYYREHGDCLVKKAYPGGLGEWVIQQRKRYKALLAEQCGGDEEVLFAMDERTRRLKEAGFVFSCRVRRWRRKPVEEGPGE